MTLNDSTKLFGITARAKGKYRRTANAITDIYSSTMLYSIYQALQGFQCDNGKLSAEKYIHIVKRHIINITNTVAAKMRQEIKGKSARDWKFTRTVVPKIIKDYRDAVNTLPAFITNSTDGYGNVSLGTLISDMTLENCTDGLGNPIRSFNFFQSSSLFPT